ncbi:MAG: YcnI family protein [Polaromonas sp.]
MLAIPAFSHIVLETKTAPAGSAYKAVFQVGHGCQGSATTGISVQIPTGFQGAKPYPKAGWALVTKLGKLVKPYDSHGKQISEDVTVVSWTASSKDAALQDAHFDEFTLRGKLPEAAGPLWFKVLQSCESGSLDWSELPAAGASSKGLKFPAVLLEVTGQEGAATKDSAPVHAPGAHQH